MSENPYISGQFYEGAYVTAESPHTFRDAVRDQRPAFLVEIEGSKETDVIALKKVRGNGTIWSYYIRSDGVRIKASNDAELHSLSTLGSTNTLWYLTRYDHPAYLVFTDPSGTMKYVSYDTAVNGGLVATSSPPAGIGPSRAQFVGPYLDLLSDDGITTYRMTVRSDNVVIQTQIKVEPERVDTLRLSQGMLLGAFRGGKLYKEAIINVADIEQSLDTVEWGYGGVAVPRVGNISLQLSTKEYDWLTRQRWDTRKITISSGSTTANPITWPIAIRSQTQSAEWGHDELDVTLRDYGIFLERSVQPNTYAGTGSYEGDTDLQGRVKPLGYGACRNVNPVLIDERRNIYQVNDGPIEAIFLVRDRGRIVPAIGDVSTSTTYTNVFDWNPTSSEFGRYITDLSRGIFRLATPADGEVRVSFGGSTATGGARTLASFVRAISTTRMPEVSIDQSSFDAHAERMPNFCNLYIDEDITIQEVFHDLIAPSGGIIFINRLGQLVLRHLEIGIPRAHLLDRDISNDVPFHRFNPPKPGSVYKGGANRIYATMTSEQFVPNFDETVKQFLMNEYRYNIVDLNNTVGSISYRRYESAKTITLYQPFDFMSDAAFWLKGIVHRQQTFRDVYEFSVRQRLFTFELGDTLILESPRFGMDVPRYGLVVYVGDRANDQVSVLRVWC